MYRPSQTEYDFLGRYVMYKTLLKRYSKSQFFLFDPQRPNLISKVRKVFFNIRYTPQNDLKDRIDRHCIKWRTSCRPCHGLEAILAREK